MTNKLRASVTVLKKDVVLEFPLLMKEGVKAVVGDIARLSNPLFDLPLHKGENACSGKQKNVVIYAIQH
ncbi:hypothetical protein L0244_38270 [bacterium]|nr:hypothetical protein [bacterium]